jgi:hypothetical protein
MIRRFILVFAVLISHLATASGAHAQVGVDDSDLGESIYLLKNLLKDLRRESDVEEQFRMYLRAQSVMRDVEANMEHGERTEWQRRLDNAFMQLQEPEQVESAEGVTFTVTGTKGRAFYWSEPVSITSFLAFLNDVGAPLSKVSMWVDTDANQITYDTGTSQYQSRRGARPVQAASYSGAARFADWLSHQQRQRCTLPTVGFAMQVGGDNISCWTSSAWKVKDPVRDENMRIYGVKLRTMVYHGEAVGELPEALYPDTCIRVRTSTKAGKEFFLSSLQVSQ